MDIKYFLIGDKYQQLVTGLHVNSKDGFLIDEIYHLKKHYKSQIWLKEVILPMNTILDKSAEFGSKVDRIIIGSQYYLLDPDVVKQFCLPIVPYFVNKLCELGDLQTLIKWKNSNLPFIYDESAIDLATQNGHKQILDWWLTSKLEIKYTHLSVDNASDMADINMLDWWRTSGLPLKYTREAINRAFEQNFENITDWWRTSDLNIIVPINEYIDNFCEKNSGQHYYR